MGGPETLLGVIGLALSVLFWFLKRRKPKTKSEVLKDKLEDKQEAEQKDLKALKEDKFDDVQESISNRIDNITFLDKLLRRKKDNS